MLPCPQRMAHSGSLDAFMRFLPVEATDLGGDMLSGPSERDGSVSGGDMDCQEAWV